MLNKGLILEMMNSYSAVFVYVYSIFRTAWTMDMKMNSINKALKCLAANGQILIPP